MPIPTNEELDRLITGLKTATKNYETNRFSFDLDVARNAEDELRMAALALGRALNAGTEGS